jgi:hypothetical protein
MIDFLLAEKMAGRMAESGWKNTTWDECAKKLQGTEPRGSAEKTSGNCSTKFTKVCTVDLL